MRLFSNVLAWMCVGALTACGVSGSGDYGIDHRTVTDFDRIEVEDGVDAFVVVDPMADSGAVTLSVSGDDNLLDHVQTWVSGRTLYVQADAWMWTDLNLRVTATVGYLGSAVVSDDSRLTASHLYDRFEIEAEDSSWAGLSGHVHSLDVYARDYTRVDAIDLRARSVFVDAVDSAEVAVCATYEVFGYGGDWTDVAIYCNPEIIDFNQYVDILF